MIIPSALRLSTTAVARRQVVLPARSATTIYGYDQGGWRLSDETTAAGARYRDHYSASGVDPDRAVAARAVACVELVK